MASLLVLGAFCMPAAAQDDVTTQNGSSGYGGAWITGPASNPLSFLNGPAFRTTGQNTPYDFPDFAPMTALDHKLPSWIGFGLEERLRWEDTFNASFKPNNDDGYALNRLRFLMQIKPTNWLRIVGQVQDARAWWQNPPLQPPNTNRLDLKLAYAEVGDPEHHWISVRVGRQLINYNNTIIANSEWRDQGRSYDAAVANLHVDRFHLGIFAASAVVPLDEGISHHQEGNNIYGMYGGIDNLVPSSSLEPFVLWRVAPSVSVEPTADYKAKTGHESEQAYGIRWKGLAFNNFDYSIEGIREAGTDGPNNISAWGTTDGLAYRFSSMYWKPRVFSQYDYASGDKNPKDGTHGAFDTMYPTAHDRFGISDQFGWQNIKAVRAGVTIEPHNRWTVTGQWLDFWLASATDSLYNTSGGSIVRNTAGTAGNHVGQEADVYTWYELNRHVNVGVGYAHIFPGQYLTLMEKGPNYSYPYFALNFKDAGTTH
jgi:Alginate export